MCLETFPVLRDGDMAVVTLPAEVDISTSGRLREVLLSAVDSNPATLVVDMSVTEFCDSAALSAMIVAHRQAAAAGVRFRLVATGPAVLRVLSITGVDKLIELHPTLAGARMAAGPARGPEPEPVPD